jgi:hypothetical protein
VSVLRELEQPGALPRLVLGARPLRGERAEPQRRPPHQHDGEHAQRHREHPGPDGARVEPLALAGEAEEADHDREQRHRQEQAPQQHAARVVAPQDGNAPVLRVREGEPEAEREQRDHRRPGDDRRMRGAVERRDPVEEAHRGHERYAADCGPERHRDAPPPREREEPRPEEREPDCPGRPHPVATHRLQRLHRLGRDELVDPEVHS